MMKILIFTLSLMAVSLAEAQPVVNFNNDVSSVFRAPVFGVDPQFPFTQFRETPGYGGDGPLLAGNGYTAELWAGPLGTTEDSLESLGTTSFRTGAGAGFVVAGQLP